MGVNRNDFNDDETGIPRNRQSDIDFNQLTVGKFAEKLQFWHDKYVNQEKPETTLSALFFNHLAKKVLKKISPTHKFALNMEKKIKKKEESTAKRQDFQVFFINILQQLNPLVDELELKVEREKELKDQMALEKGLEPDNLSLEELQIKLINSPEAKELFLAVYNTYPDTFFEIMLDPHDIEYKDNGITVDREALKENPEGLALIEFVEKIQTMQPIKKEELSSNLLSEVESNPSFEEEEKSRNTPKSR